MPRRGAKFPYVVCHNEVPAGANVIAEGLLTFNQDAKVVEPRPSGAGLSSHRTPYVSTSLREAFQLS